MVQKYIQDTYERERYTYVKMRIRTDNKYGTFLFAHALKDRMYKVFQNNHQIFHGQVERTN